MSKKKAAAPRKVGVIIANTGTPEAPTRKAVKKYLSQFLMDPRICPMPRPVWWTLLHTHILGKRSRASAEKYEKIWTEEGSPLIAITTSLERGLNEYYADQGPARHGARGHELWESPQIKRVVKELKEAGCTELGGAAHVPAVGLLHYRLGERRGGKSGAPRAIQGRRVPHRRLWRRRHLRPGRGRLHPQRGLFRRVGRSPSVLVPLHSAEGHRGGGYLRAADRGHEFGRGRRARARSPCLDHQLPEPLRQGPHLAVALHAAHAGASGPGRRAGQPPVHGVSQLLRGLPGDALRRALRAGAPLPGGARRAWR